MPYYFSSTFQCQNIWFVIKKEKSIYALGVSTLFEALISNDNKKIDLSFIKYVISGGDILSRKLETRVNT